MGGAIVRKPVFEAFMAAPEGAIELPHGYTYCGHPLAAAAAVAALDLYRDEGLFERSRAIEPLWADAVMSLKDLPGILDIRTIGLAAGIDLQPRPGAAGRRAYEVMVAAYEAGAMVRVTADTIALSPPLIVDEATIARLVDIRGGRDQEGGVSPNPWEGGVFHGSGSEIRTR